MRRVGGKKRICRLQGKGGSCKGTGAERNFIHGRSRTRKKENERKVAGEKEVGRRTHGPMGQSG